MAIIVNDFLDPESLKEKYPTFITVDDCQRENLEVGMEVKLRRNGENFRVRIDEIQGDVLTGKVLSGTFYFSQPFVVEDIIQFKRSNVINIYDINRWGVLL